MEPGALPMRRQALYHWVKSQPLFLLFVLCFVECCLVWLLHFETNSCYVAHDGLEVTLFLPPER